MTGSFPKKARPTCGIPLLHMPVPNSFYSHAFLVSKEMHRQLRRP